MPSAGSIKCLIDIQTGIGDIINDSDGEAILRLTRVEIIEDRLYHRRRKFLRAKAVSAADNHRIIFERPLLFAHRLADSRANIQI